MAHLLLQVDDSVPPSRPPSPPPITIFPPDSNDAFLQSVPVSSLMGQWHVVASTLPLWNDKKNVTITYSHIPGEPATTFDDLVQYNKRTDSPGKKPSQVVGIDKKEGSEGARWKWRGKGLLMVASAHWQLLGYRLLPPSSVAAAASAPPGDPEWCCTYFSSTLFTPAGLDIYSRTKHMDPAFIQRIIDEIEKLGGEVTDLCKKDQGMFIIPHD